VRSSDPRVHYKRKFVQAFIGVLIGAGVLAAGLVTHRVYLEGAGAAVLALSVLWLMISWRRHVARTRPARAKASPAQSAAGPARTGQVGRASGQTRRSRLMERMEERWRRRQEGDRRM
jgi:hypothetical protein